METKANTVKGLFQSYIKKAKEIGNTDVQLILEEMLVEANRITVHYSVQPKIRIELKGWKGTGQIDIYKNFENDFTIVEYIKDKETLEVKEHITEVHQEKVNQLCAVIRQLKIGEKVKCYEIARLLGWVWKDLWRERKIYFSDYYYPTKVLEKLGVIKYKGRGTVIRLI